MVCPCGTGRAYAECCEPLIRGQQRAETAQQLMRSRYSAYVYMEMDHILASLHPSKRDEHDGNGARDWAEKSEWRGLEIIDTRDGGPSDNEGTVEFVAEYTLDGEQRTHHEEASFVREDGDWYFVEGHPVTQRPFVRENPKIGRNDPCSCGSGRKFKRCCGS